MLTVSSLIQYIDKDGLSQRSLLDRDASRSLDEACAIFDQLLATPPFRDAHYSGDKAQMVVVARGGSTPTYSAFGVIFYFEDETTRYEPIGPGVPSSFGRADAYILKEAMRLLDMGESPVPYLQEHGGLELYED